MLMNTKQRKGSVVYGCTLTDYPNDDVGRNNEL